MKTLKIICLCNRLSNMVCVALSFPSTDVLKFASYREGADGKGHLRFVKGSLVWTVVASSHFTMCRGSWHQYVIRVYTAIDFKNYSLLGNPRVSRIFKFCQPHHFCRTCQIHQILHFCWDSFVRVLRFKKHDLACQIEEQTALIAVMY